MHSRNSSIWKDYLKCNLNFKFKQKISKHNRKFNSSGILVKSLWIGLKKFNREWMGLKCKWLFLKHQFNRKSKVYHIYWNKMFILIKCWFRNIIKFYIPNNLSSKNIIFKVQPVVELNNFLWKLYVHWANFKKIRQKVQNIVSRLQVTGEKLMICFSNVWKLQSNHWKIWMQVKMYKLEYIYK